MFDMFRIRVRYRMKNPQSDNDAVAHLAVDPIPPWHMTGRAIPITYSFEHFSQNNNQVLTNQSELKHIENNEREKLQFSERWKIDDYKRTTI